MPIFRYRLSRPITGRTRTESPERAQLDDSSTLLGELEHLYQNRILTDVIITVGNIELAAHSQFLAMRSKYFERLFASDFVEAKQRRIKLNEQPEVIKQLLRYIYTGRVRYDSLVELVYLWHACEYCLFELTIV